MARQRQYADPISIPFRFETKDRIFELSEAHDVAQADVVRWAVEGGGLDEVDKKLRDGTLG